MELGLERLTLTAVSTPSPTLTPTITPTLSNPNSNYKLFSVSPNCFELLCFLLGFMLPNSFLIKLFLCVIFCVWPIKQAFVMQTPQISPWSCCFHLPFSTPSLSDDLGSYPNFSTRTPATDLQTDGDFWVFYPKPYSLQLQLKPLQISPLWDI